MQQAAESGEDEGQCEHEDRKGRSVRRGRAGEPAPPRGCAAPASALGGDVQQMGTSSRWGRSEGRSRVLAVSGFGQWDPASGIVGLERSTAEDR